MPRSSTTALNVLGGASSDRPTSCLGSSTSRPNNTDLHQLPEWRITCFFVGLVESYPEETFERKVSGSFLHNATVAFFERHGFERDRQIGKHHWVVTRRVS
jgi:hypothetical protein